MKKWNRSLGTSKKQQGVETPRRHGHRRPEGWSHRLWRYKQLIKELLRNNPRWKK